MSRIIVAFLCGLVLPVVFSLPGVGFAQSEIERLQGQIQERNSRLLDIEREIARYEAELRAVGAERRTLQQAINELELERKKVQAEIARTENLISATDLEINKLVLEIARTEREIGRTEEAIAQIIRTQYKAEDDSLLLLLLRHRSLSEFWSAYEAHENVRNGLSAKVGELTGFHAVLEDQRRRSENKRRELQSLRGQYSDQNAVLTNNRNERAELLEVTRNEERNYQQLLSQRQQARDLILKELREFEAQLQFILDPNTIPPPGTRVFDWPLKNVIITQYFGGSEFARRNPSVYGGRPYHPGIDLGAPRGTPIYAPLSGVVRATGNTDLVPGCYSWGKWTLIDHANGLATLYAHQDVISVAPGQRVNTGDIIGYTGNTGFSTGPHLHFTVYAKDGVNVRRFNEIKTVTSCGPASTPVAAIEAYIDPMLYLPPP